MYVPVDLDIPFILDYQPKIYCDDLAVGPFTRIETHIAKIHNQVSVANFSDFWGYKTYSFDGTRFAANSLVRLDTQLTGHNGILFSIIENQVVKMKNGYIGLAF